MKLFQQLLVAPAALGLLAPLSASASEINLDAISNYSEGDLEIDANSFKQKSSNNILETFLSVFSFSDLDQKAEFEFKEQLKIKINII